MPIRINLLAEALAEEDLRRRDPVKRAIFGGSFLVVLALVWFSSIWLEYMLAGEKLTQIRDEIQSHSNDWSQVKINLNMLADTQKKLNALQKLSNSRFLQGNLMNALQQLYVPNVQLTRLRVEQNYTQTSGSPGTTNNYGVIPGRAGTSTERIVLTMDAKDLSPNPGDAVNPFKNALLKQDYFAGGLNASNGVRLTSLSPPQAAMDSKPFVMFTLECRFSDITR
jgi:hypothetical protein